MAPDSAGTVTDAVGPNAAGYFSGTALSAMTGSPTDQYAWVRIQTTGHPKNTINNAADFALVSTTGGVIGGLQSMLGSPSPTGLTDPYQLTTTLKSSLVDSGKTSIEVPNRVIVPGASGQPTILTIRRVITNNTATTMSAIKVRIISLSEANGLTQAGVPGQTVTSAKLRVVNPATSTSSVTTGTGSVTVQNLSLDGPSISTVGGGLNSTLTVPGTLAPGASVNISLTFAADVGGSYWFIYDVDGSVAN